MVKIRLARAGAKKRPFYHLVAADSRSPRDGRFIERLGFFNPIAVGGEVRLRVNTERVDHWMARGAQLTDRAAKLVGEAREQPSTVADGGAPEADGAAAEAGAEVEAPAAETAPESESAPDSESGFEPKSEPAAEAESGSEEASEASAEASAEPAEES